MKSSRHWVRVAWVRCTVPAIPASRDWVGTPGEALNQARKRDEIRGNVDAEQAAFELNRILIGAQWSHLMAYTKERFSKYRLMSGMLRQQLRSFRFAA
jgi:hypothetical protein